MTSKTSTLARAPAALAITTGAVIVGAVFIIQGFTFLPVIGIFLGLAVIWWGLKAGWRVLRLTEPAPVRAPRAETRTATISPAAILPEVERDDDGFAFPVPDWIPSAGPDKVETIPSGS